MALAWPPSEELELSNKVVTMRKYDANAAPEMADALRDPLIWEHIPTDRDGPRDWDAYAARGAANGRWPFVIRLTQRDGDLPEGTVVGCSSFYDVSVENSHLSIGYTTYRAEVWGTRVNPATKLLLLGFAFDVAAAQRVQFKTDNLNRRSQAALVKIGATREGVLRSHMQRRDGSFRDSVVFSVIRPEWPKVRRHLQRLAGLE